MRIRGNSKLKGLTRVEEKYNPGFIDYRCFIDAVDCNGRRLAHMAARYKSRFGESRTFAE